VVANAVFCGAQQGKLKSMFSCSVLPSLNRSNKSLPAHPPVQSIFTDAEFSIRRPIEMLIFEMLIFTTTVFNATDVLTAGWFQYRGPQRNGLSREATLPTANVEWHRIQPQKRDNLFLAG
jgi:hypothetical protein